MNSKALMRTNNIHITAFSLVELSIVLVILGLLVGGVLSGQSLIRAAELRSVLSDANKFKTAILSFRDKYQENPGDMTKATLFWGAADGGDGVDWDCREAQTNDQRTCNGNGDGFIRGHPDLEDTRLWQHLSNSGLIEGKYIGTQVPYITVCPFAQPGCAFPGSKISPNIWVIGAQPSMAYLWTYYANRNLLFLSDVVSQAPWFSVEQGFNFIPEEAWNIDTKMDDGRPGTGSVASGRFGYCTTGAWNDASEAARLSATYNLNSKQKYCILTFVDIM